MTVPLRRIRIAAWACCCQRCNWQWRAYEKEPPKTCAKCKASGWTKPARPYGRPKMGE